MSFPQLPFCALRTRRISKALSGFGLPLISSSSAVDLIREASSSLELRSVESSLIASEIKQSYSTIPIGGIDSQAVVAEVKQAIAYSALDLIGSQLNLNIVEPDIDSDMAIYKGKYNAAGSTFAAGEQSALNILITTLKTTGVWSKIGFLWICPASPSNTASGAVYLKPYSAINSMTLNNFVLGDFSIDGLIGDGSTKYADTNIVSSNLFDTTNMGLGIYSHTASMRVEAEIGSYSSSDGTAFIQISANLLRLLF